MTATPIATLPAPEVAVMLRVRLGPLRAWGDFLADCIRGKASVEGYTLIPCGRMWERCWRPVYAVSDVEDFIAKVLAAVPGAGKSPVTPTTLGIDRRLHWRLNKFDRAGTPITTPCTAPAAYGVAS